MSSKSRSFMAAAVLFFAVVGTVHAQDPITVKIPFDFATSGKTLPAGTYVFREALPNSATQLAVLDGKGHSALASATTLESNDTGSKLVFHKYGESYFLADIFSSSGRLHFSPGRAEAKLAQTADAQSIPIAVGE